MNKKMFLFPFIILLTACSGGDGDGGDRVNSSNTGGDNGVTYAELRSDYDRIRKESARSAQNEGYTSDLPTSGTGTYAGIASFSEDASPQIIANASLGVNFKDSTISGKLTDFRGNDGTVFDGDMNISNGSINASNSSITADIDGQLISDSARMSTVDATGQFDGHFIGDNHRYVRGQTSATWITNAGMGTEEHITMQGELAAEKNY